MNGMICRTLHTVPYRAPAAAVLVAAVVLVSATMPAASGATTLKPGDKYVALGSSYASGPMIPVQSDTGCLRSTNNYPGLLARKLKLALTDVSCGAATTDHIISIPQKDRPPQIDAVTPDTKLVTVTIGGNDVNYTVSNLACGGESKPGQPCIGTVVHPEEIDAAFATLPAKLAATFQAIKDKAPSAKIVALPYLRVFPSSATPCPPSVTIQPADLQYLVQFSDRLHTAIKDAAKAAKVIFVDSYAPTGHDACAPESKRWVEGEQPASPAVPFHPNANGMKAEAAMITAALGAKRH
jgi:lysophospholipase L1-like esterase